MAVAFSVSPGRRAAKARQMSSACVRSAKCARWKRRRSACGAESSCGAASWCRSAVTSPPPEAGPMLGDVSADELPLFQQIGRLGVVDGPLAFAHGRDVDVGGTGPQGADRAALLGDLRKWVEPVMT